MYRFKIINKLDIGFVETSALNMINIEYAFRLMAESKFMFKGF